MNKHWFPCCPLACESWHVISSQAHLFSKYFLMIQIQTSFQLNRKRRWTVNRAEGNIIIGGKLKHGNGGILNGQIYGRLSFRWWFIVNKKQGTFGNLHFLSSCIHQTWSQKYIIVVPRITLNKAYLLCLICHLESECGDILSLIGF